MVDYGKELSETINAKKAACPDVVVDAETALLKKLSALTSCLYKKIAALDAALLDVKFHTEVEDCAKYYGSSVINAMNELRAVADELEVITAKSAWPFPSYGDMLFSIK